MRIRLLEQAATNVPPHDEWLSAAELARLESLRFARRRADWRLGRWTAKTAVTAHLGLPSDAQTFRALEVRAAPSGAPEVFLRDVPARVSISLSHRAGRGACAIAEAGLAVGCDLEIVEPRCDAFVADYFTSEEQAMVRRAPAAERHWLVTLLWSAKECALKALRTGLRVDTRSLVVHAGEIAGSEKAVWSPFAVRFRDDQEFSGYSRCRGDVLCAVAADRPVEVCDIRL